MEHIARQALTFWPITATDLKLVAQRENVVFRLTASDGTMYALRLHRPGYQTIEAIRSELDWMGCLAQHGIRVPRPVPSGTKDLVAECEGYSVDVLTWLDGRPLGTTGVPLDLQNREAVFHKIGDLLARVHDASDMWEPRAAFQRPVWDRAGLLGKTPLWDRFWENPGLTSDQRSLFLEVRNAAAETLQSGPCDYGLIHADMVRENLLLQDQGIALIDFDDSGFGYRLFDVATALLKNRSEPDFQDLQRALIDGYSSRRVLDVSHLPMFMAIRSLTYVGWIISRMGEPGAEVRQRRFVANAVDLSRAFLDH